MSIDPLATQQTSVAGIPGFPGPFAVGRYAARLREKLREFAHVCVIGALGVRVSVEVREPVVRVQVDVVGAASPANEQADREQDDEGRRHLHRARRNQATSTWMSKPKSPDRSRRCRRR